MRAWLLRVLALAVPVMAAYVAASIAGSSLPTDAGWWWLAVVAAGVIAAGIGMRPSSRFQLLAMAYEMELLFPGPAPQRSEVVDLVRKPDLLTASGSATEAAARVVATRPPTTTTTQGPPPPTTTTTSPPPTTTTAPEPTTTTTVPPPTTTTLP